MPIENESESYKLGYRHGSDSELPDSRLASSHKEYIEGYAQGSQDRDDRLASGKGYIPRPAWINDAQIEAVRKLYKRSPDGARDWYDFFTRVQEHGIGSDRYAGLSWCGMFVGIEADGYTHT